MNYALQIVNLKNNIRDVWLLLVFQDHFTNMV